MANAPAGVYAAPHIISAQSQTNRPFCSRAIHHTPSLRNHEATRCNQAQCSRTHRPHQRLPLLPLLRFRHGPRHLARADRLPRTTLLQQPQDLRFQLAIPRTHLNPAAPIAAELHRIPILRPALPPLHPPPASRTRLLRPLSTHRLALPRPVRHKLSLARIYIPAPTNPSARRPRRTCLYT